MPSSTITNKSAIIANLKRIIAELEADEPLPAGGGAPAPADGWKRARVTFWAVDQGTSKAGKPFTKGTVGLAWVENGRDCKARLSTFDEKLIGRIDPLEKGACVEYQSVQKGEYENLADLRVTRA